MNGLASLLRQIFLHIRLLKFNRIPYSHAGLWAGAVLAQGEQQVSLWWSLGGVALFVLFYGGLYLMNDLLNYKKDRRDPSLMKRPLQSGAVPYWAGALFFVFVLGVGLGVCWVYYQQLFLYFLLLLGINVLYSGILKYVAYADVFFVSATQPVKMAIGLLLFSSVVNWPSFAVIMVLLYISSIASHTRKQSNRMLRAKPKEMIIGMQTELGLRAIRMVSIGLVGVGIAIYFPYIASVILIALVLHALLLIIADLVPWAAETMAGHDRVQSTW